jgi:hypothetical protein
MSKWSLYYSLVSVVFLLSLPFVHAQESTEDDGQDICVDSSGCPVVCWRQEAEKKQNDAIAKTTASFEDDAPPAHSETSCISDYSKIGLEVSADLLTLPSLSDLFNKAKDAACDATDSYLQSIVRRSDIAMDLPLGASIGVDLYEGGDGLGYDIDYGQGLEDVIDDVIDDVVDDVVEDVVEDPLDGVFCWKLPPGHPRFCGGDINELF